MVRLFIEQIDGVIREPVEGERPSQVASQFGVEFRRYLTDAPLPNGDYRVVVVPYPDAPQPAPTPILGQTPEGQLPQDPALGT